MGEMLRLTGTVDLQAASEAGKPPTAAIMAYSGGAMFVKGFGKVVVDLASLQMPEVVTLLGDHEQSLASVVGSGVPRIFNHQLFVDGTIAASEPSGQRIVNLRKSGVRLQASVGVEVRSPREQVRADESIQINGRVIKAGRDGFGVVRGGLLKEVSVVAFGADDSTYVDIAAKGNHMNETIEASNGDLLKADRRRIADINAIVEDRAVKLGVVDDDYQRRRFQAMAQEAIDDGTDPKEFETRVVEAANRLLVHRTTVEDRRANFSGMTWGRNGHSRAGQGGGAQPQRPAHGHVHEDGRP